MKEPSGHWCSPRLGSEPLRELGRPWVVLDLETTGLDPSRDIVTEFAAIVLDADLRQVEEHKWCASDGPEALSTVATALSGPVRDGVMVAHNAAFDLGFLRQHPDPRTAHLGEAPRWLCTLCLVGGGLSLGQLAQTQGVAVHSAHTATGDSAALALVFARLVGAALARGLSTVADLAVVVPSTAVGGTLEDPSITAELSFDAVRALLDTVVPIPPISTLQRDRFVEASRSPSVKVAADRLGAAGVSAVALDLLLEEAEILRRSSGTSRRYDL